MDKTTSLDIIVILKNSLRNKFANYNPEPAVLPFHTRLIGKDRLALYQFIHSLNTNFGTTIFEPVAVKLAEGRFRVAKEFWAFLGGEGAYEDLLNCFEQVGIEMREEIDEYFSRFR